MLSGDVPNNDTLSMKIPFELFLSIGVTQSERAILQKIDIVIDILFSSIPTVCKNDIFDHEQCYDTFVSNLTNKFTKNTYNTIEFLAQQLCEFSTTFFKSKYKSLRVTLTKYPACLKNGVSVVYQRQNDKIWS